MKRGPFRHMDRGEFIALLLALLVLSVGITAQVRSVVSDRESCVRGNNLRYVVLNNSQAAVEQSIANNDPQKITDEFTESVNVLLGGPEVGADGQVACDDANPMPFPLNLFGL